MVSFLEHVVFQFVSSRSFSSKQYDFHPLSAHGLEGGFSALSKTARKRSSARARRWRSTKEEAREKTAAVNIFFSPFFSSGGDTTYSFLTSVTAVVMAGSVASACGGKRGIIAECAAARN